LAVLTDQESVQNRLSYQGGHTARIDGLIGLSREKSAIHLKAYEDAVDSACLAALALVEQLKGSQSQTSVPEANQPSFQAADFERHLEAFRLQAYETVQSVSHRAEYSTCRLETHLRDLENRILNVHSRVNSLGWRFQSVEDGEVLAERALSVFPDPANTVDQVGGLEKRVAELEKELKDERKRAEGNERRFQVIEEQLQLILLENRVGVDFFR
jgi:hypothetical protein